jgi:DNA-directed RNA polymerase subunit RPC12/RpoP
MSQLDILTIDAKIKHAFREESNKLPQYKEKLLDLHRTDKNRTFSARACRNLKTTISDLEEKIETLSSGQKMNFYIVETAHLVEIYKKILSTPIKLSFTGKPARDDKEKKKVIETYLEIALKYVDIENTTPIKSRRVICNNCPNKIMFDIIDKSIYICISCGAQQEILLHTSSYKDIDRINISAKYTYDRKVHFRDCINQYQGKQNSTIDPCVYTSLFEQFRKHHLLFGPKKSTNEEKCKNITKEHIHLFLKELEHTKHYENVNLIHYQMTGKRPDNISYLEDILLDDFDSLTDLYDKKFKNKPGFERKNFINTQYVLYQLLVRYRHPCKKEDFTILKTVDRKSFHDDVAKICFEELGWNHTPLF